MTGNLVIIICFTFYLLSQKTVNLNPKMSNLINLVIRRTMSSASGAINHVTVVGAGLMGSGIAQVSKHGIVWDQSPKSENFIVS